MLHLTEERRRLLRDRLEFYRNHLHEYILPFWLKNGIDREYGGYFTCFNNYGDELVSTDKYVWSQGRMLWLLGELAQREGPASEYRALARSGYEFLKRTVGCQMATAPLSSPVKACPRNPYLGKGTRSAPMLTVSQFWALPDLRSWKRTKRLPIWPWRSLIP